MKKIVYLCCLIVLSMNLKAQIDPYDNNWEIGIIDHFNDPNRQFDNTFQEPQRKWISYSDCLWPSGVTKLNYLHIYQWNHCLIDAPNSVIKLNSSFIRSTPISCNEQPNYYDIPPATFGVNYHCDSENSNLYYYSGILEPLPANRFWYGYYEIKCRLPIHPGAFPAFWLWDAEKNHYYEEIDIFEYSWLFEDIASHGYSPNPHGAGNPYCFTTGIYYNDINSNHGWTTSRARNFPMISDSLSNWHTYSCEWMPDRLIWYCDGNVVNEYYNPDSIPHHTLTLKTNYAIDRYALTNHSLNGIPEWQSNDNMIIDYIKVYQMKWDCDTDELISQQLDLDNFYFAVKNSITVSSSIELVKIRNTDKITFRAADSFEITGPFQVDNGGEMTVIIQSCPNIH